MWSAKLLFHSPEMIDRTCAKCQAYFYEDTAGVMGPLLRLDDGRPMPRPTDDGKPGDTPCYQCPKVPKDAPARTREHAIEPTERSLDALRHYERCIAIGNFPDDEIVQRNAELIGPIYRTAEIASARDAAGVIALLIASGGKRG